MVVIVSNQPCDDRRVAASRRVVRRPGIAHKWQMATENEQTQERRNDGVGAGGSWESVVANVQHALPLPRSLARTIDQGKT